MATIEDFKKLDLRIAEVIKVTPHPNADRLWILQVRVGEEEREIVAGIRQFYTEEALVGKKIVLVSNLEPATIRGVASYGMLLAASTNDHIVILTPDKDIPSGAVVK